MKINSYIRKYSNRQRKTFRTLDQQNAATSYSLIEQHQSPDCGWNISTLFCHIHTYSKSTKTLQYCYHMCGFSSKTVISVNNRSLCNCTTSEWQSYSPTSALSVTLLLYNRRFVTVLSSFIRDIIGIMSSNQCAMCAVSETVMMWCWGWWWKE